MSWFLDDAGKEIGKSSMLKITEMKDGYKSSMSGKEFEVVEQIDKRQFDMLTKGMVAENAESEETTVKTTTAVQKQFKSHASTTDQIERKSVAPRNDPNAKDALVLFTPPESGVDESGATLTHVVVDPIVSRHLRPHQRRGVQFLYDCVTGVRHPHGHGAILADQMGLGKTLQTLALLWTLMRQSANGPPLVRRAIIVTPATLVGNWRKEIIRWLGTERIKPITLSDSGTKTARTQIEEFASSPVHPVIILSYEQCRIFAPIVATLSCGLLICDEGHRLKNTASQTTVAINAIKATRRILLSGTPIQNDLTEFYAMVDFCNPGSLGPLPQFKREFAMPIQKLRDSPRSTGTSKAIEKLCNHPVLIQGTEYFKPPYPTDFKKDLLEPIHSGKMLFVEQLVKSLQTVGERVVLVSNYTQTLDVFQDLLKIMSISSLRLDGQVNPDERQALVDKFNDPSNKNYPVFLLSAKAGGVGINLIGANHIVLFDPDWNPAIDQQAMERVWREGQTKPVSIYRLLSIGTIEEKIYQRQLMKESISNSVVDKKYSDKSGFSDEDLKDIFSLNETTNSETHDLLMCSCSGGHSKSNINSSSAKSQLLQTINHLEKWDHFNDLKNIKNSFGASIFQKTNFNTVEYVFKSKYSPPSTKDDQDDGQGVSFLETEECVSDEAEEEKIVDDSSKKKRTREKEVVVEEEDEEEETVVRVTRRSNKNRPPIDDDLDDLDI
eukprot:gene12145-14211_t